MESRLKPRGVDKRTNNRVPSCHFPTAPPRRHPAGAGSRLGHEGDPRPEPDSGGSEIRDRSWCEEHERKEDLLYGFAAYAPPASLPQRRRREECGGMARTARTPPTSPPTKPLGTRRRSVSNPSPTTTWASWLGLARSSSATLASMDWTFGFRWRR